MERDCGQFLFFILYIVIMLTLPDQDMVIGETEYYITYTSAVNKGNCYAVQFHPEKSGTLGIQLLQNWITLC